MDWAFEGSLRKVLGCSQCTDWSDQIDTLSIYEALWVRGRQIGTQQDLAERDGFEGLIQREHAQILTAWSVNEGKWADLSGLAARVGHGRRLLFSWYQEGW